MTESSQFSKDHVLRDKNNRPIARAVIKEGFKFEIGKSIPVAVLLVSSKLIPDPLPITYYVDGTPYRIPSDTSKIRFLTANGLHYVNSFFLKVYDGK